MEASSQTFDSKEDKQSEKQAAEQSGLTTTEALGILHKDISNLLEEYEKEYHQNKYVFN